MNKLSKVLRNDRSGRLRTLTLVYQMHYYPLALTFKALIMRVCDLVPRTQSQVQEGCGEYSFVQS